jgi:putative lipoprotein
MENKITMKKPMFLIIALLLAAILAACGGQEEAPTVAPTAAPAEAEVQPAVEEPAAEPTTEPAPEPTEETLPESPLDQIEFAVDPNLVDATWEWVQRTTTTGDEVLLTVSNPENYTLLFNADATFSAKLDCNNGAGGYATDGNGSIFMQLGPMTAAACEPESLAPEMGQMFGPAQSYVYEDDGNTVIFKFVAGGPWDYYRKAGSGGQAPEAGDAEIIGVTWQWEGFQDQSDGEGTDITVPNPDAYTLTLQPDGTAAIKADCNLVSWTYTLEGSSLSFNTLGPSTLAFCPEPSLSEQYLALLGNTATFVTEGDKLILNLFADAGNMIFGAGDSLAIKPEMISLDTQGLSASWQAVVVPATPYDESQPPGPMGLPAHVEILFGVSDPADREPQGPIMYIIPANTYRKMWNEAGNNSVARTMQEIQRLNFLLTQPAPTSGYPVLPYEEVAGFNDLAVQVGKAVKQGEVNTTSATQDGYRLVGRWAQDANPVTNQNLRYVYQGFSNDGVYLVSFWWPEATSALPDDVSGVSAEQMEAFNADPTAAINGAAEELNSLSTDQWDPDLATLDALVASLEIEGMTVSGLLDKTWVWTQGPVQPGSSEIVEVPDPERYQVTYGSDGTMNFVADCNSGSMSFELNDSGMSGGMLAMPGPTTLAECEPESLYNGFINALTAAQSYRVWAGGNELELVLPAGGGVLLLRDINAPAPSSATVSGMITNVDSAAIPEGATVTVQIQDTSLADVAATVMGEQIISNPGQFPIAYEVAYDPSQIIDNHTYTMSARITASDGSLLFINDTSIPGITRDSPTEDVEITVVQVVG